MEVITACKYPLVFTVLFILDDVLFYLLDTVMTGFEFEEDFLVPSLLRSSLIVYKLSVELSEVELSDESVVAVLFAAAVLAVTLITKLLVVVAPTESVNLTVTPY
jgi:hypothetical protein